MRISVIACIALALFVSGTQKESADRIYVNANIWTGDAANSRATCIAIKDSVIIYVGNDFSSYKGASTQIIDVEGKMIVPGFIDNHTHFLSGGFQLTSVNLHDAKTEKEFITTLKQYATAHNDNRWIQCGDWDHEAWGGELPTREWIDSVTGNHPVFINRYDGHMGLANSIALKMAHIDKTTPNPPGGEIVKDAKGEPTGVLRDGATTLVYRVIPVPTKA